MEQAWNTLQPFTNVRGFVLYVKMPEPTTPLTISDPRGGLVATKWGKVLVNGWQLFQVKIVCWDLRNERFFFMFHLKKRRSEFLFFVSISLQVQHRSCNLHAVFLGLEGRGKKYFWHMILKVSTIPSCKEMHSSKILPLTLPLIFPLRLFFKKHVVFFF